MATHGFEQVRGAERVGGESFQWLGVGKAHERLGGEVKNDLGLGARERPFNGREIADVAARVGASGREDVRAHDLVKARLRRRVEREAVDLRAKLAQPEREPRTLEAGVPGDEHALAGIKAAEHWTNHQIFHGASPLCHIAVRSCCSR